MVAHNPHTPAHNGQGEAANASTLTAALVTPPDEDTLTDQRSAQRHSNSDTLERPNTDSIPEPPAPSITEPAAPPITEIVQQIHEGALAPADLDPAIRRQCVVHLTAKGFSTFEIAELLTIADRTVRRDRAAIRKEEALEPGLTLGDELLGEYQRLALASVQRLTRLAADHSTPAYARLWAEDAVARIYQNFIETVRRLGYLESGSHRLRKLSAAARASEPLGPNQLPVPDMTEIRRLLSRF